MFAAIAQMVERILGKDEVTGSIPVSSSTKNTSFGRQKMCFLNDVCPFGQMMTLMLMMLPSEMMCAFGTFLSGKHLIIDCEAIYIISAKPIHHQALCADIIEKPTGL